MVLNSKGSSLVGSTWLFLPIMRTMMGDTQIEAIVGTDGPTVKFTEGYDILITCEFKQWRQL